MKSSWLFADLSPYLCRQALRYRVFVRSMLAGRARLVFNLAAFLAVSGKEVCTLVFSALSRLSFVGGDG